MKWLAVLKLRLGIGLELGWGLITTLVMFTAILVRSKCKLVILELFRASKWNNTTAHLQQLFEMICY